MTRHRMRRLVASLAVLLPLLVFITANVAAQDFGEPEPGRHVYDRAGVLSSSEIADLEQRALAVEQAGAPVVVYLRARDATFEDTVNDARALMDDWDIQSTPGARDGLVILFNLEPGNLEHGDFAIVAGEAHVRSGVLDQDQLDRISDQMLELLRDGRIAEGIAIGLDAVARNLTAGPPPPSEFERAMSDFAGVPLNIIALAVAAGLGLFAAQRWRSRPATIAPIVPTTQVPAELPPALAGALARGRIEDAQLEAAILDLAQRGALAIEPAGRKRVQIRLLDSSLIEHPFERAVWDALMAEAVDGGLVPSDRLRRVRGRWEAARAALRAELEARGWFDPAARARRRPLYLAGLAGIVLAFLALLPVLVGQQPWGAIGIALLGGTGMMAIALGAGLRETTTEGEAAAVPWRGYLAGLEAARRDPNLELNLDQVVPYAVAMQAGGALDKRLKEASERGYAPAWLGRTLGSEAWEGGFYPYWAAFHASVSPATGGGTAASSGSAASGGSF